MSLPTIFFVGGTRSGKSALAQRWAEAQASQRLYLATCRVEDSETAARVARHQAARGPGWHCLDALPDPTACLRKAYAADAAGAQLSGRPKVILFDCISLWVADMLTSGLDATAALARVAALAALVRKPSLPTALVSAEAGLGMVPSAALGRLFRDVLGEANQCLAAACTSALFVTCGLPLLLKGALPEELC